MRENKLRLWLCGLLIGSHILVMAAAIALRMMHALLPEELTACLTLIGPMFAVYAAVVIRFISRRAESSLGAKRVSLALAVIVFLYPISFVIATLSVVLAKAFNVAFSSLEEFRMMLSVVQGAFGVYGGQMVASLFDAPLSRDTTGAH